MQILFSIPLVFFWSTVLAFVPSAIHLIIHPLESIRSEELALKKIFIIKTRLKLDREKRRRQRGIFIIYAICLALTSFFFLANWIRLGAGSVVPVDILSVGSVILFCFAVLTYLPVVLYFIFKNPWRYKDEGVYFKKAFIAYGVSIFMFSLIYAFFWVKDQGFFLGIGDILSSLSICVFGAASLSYIPILFYVLIKSRKKAALGIRPSIVFVIFAVNFLFFSGLYAHGWIADRKQGLERKPMSFYLNF